MAPTDIVTPLYRYNNGSAADHLYTTSIEEIGHANPGQPGNHGYVSEGVAGYVLSTPLPGSVPVYRYYHESWRNHFYTTNISEIGHSNHGQVGAHGYKSEGIAFYVFLQAFPGSVTLYRYFKEASRDHFYTSNPVEIGTTNPGQAGNHGYVCEGVLGHILSQPTAVTAPFYRYFRGDTNDHFYTTAISEIGHANPGQVGNHNYVYEGTAGHLLTVQLPESVPFYRYNLASVNDHFYTTNIAEIGHANVGQAGAHGYVSEGIAGYIYPNANFKTTPLYRYYKAGVHDHFYTTNPNEIGVTQQGQVGNHGYTSEGIAGHVLQL